MKDPKAESTRWIEQAKRDLEAAESLRHNGFWWLACFQAQQTAEKAVKAFLYATGERIVLGHSVADLVENAASANPGFEELRPSAKRLDRFYILTRYPNGLPGGIPAEAYSEEDAQQALVMASSILEFVVSAFSQSS